MNRFRIRHRFACLPIFAFALSGCSATDNAQSAHTAPHAAAAATAAKANSNANTTTLDARPAELAHVSGIQLRDVSLSLPPGIDPAAEAFVLNQHALKRSAARVLAQRKDVPAPEAWEKWQKLGITQESYLGNQTWILRLDLQLLGAAALERLTQEFAAEHVTLLLPVHKAATSTLAGKFGPGVYNAKTAAAKLRVGFFKSTTAAEIQAVVRAHHRGAKAAQELVSGQWELEIPANHLKTLVENDAVYFVDEPTERLPLMDMARFNTGVDAVQKINASAIPAVYNGWTGKDVIMSNGEGLAPTHDDFWDHNSSGARTYPRWLGCPDDVSAHGAMTAGIMLGNGWSSFTNGGTRYQWRGVAPLALLICEAYNPHVSNHSFIDKHIYSSLAAQLDNEAKGGRVRVGAAGNEGLVSQYSSDLGYYSLWRVGKNEIIVGNFNDRDFRWNGSSAGPTPDGRIKPDLAAFGNGSSFPREATGDIPFDLDSVTLVSAAGNRTWNFDATTPAWHGGWGQDTQGTWEWTRQNIQPVSQILDPGASGRALRAFIKPPPYGLGWPNRAFFGTATEPDGSTLLAAAGIPGDQLQIRYRFPNIPEWTGTSAFLRWTKDVNFSTTKAFNSQDFSVIADGLWHTASVPIGNNEGWTAAGSVRVVLIGFSGTRILVPTYGGNTYTAGGGSSAASPLVAGVTALLLDQIRGRLGSQLGNYTAASPFQYGGGSVGSPRPATLKALLVQTARDLAYRPTGTEINNPDTNALTIYHKGPDLISGYGLIDAAEAARVVDAVVAAKVANPSAAYYPVVERTLSTSTPHSYTIAVPAGNRLPLKVTLAWDDEPGSIVSSEVTRKLVNDLDVRLRSPSGVYYHPWTIDQPYEPSGPPQYPTAIEPEPITAASIHPARQDVRNDRDNVEKVEIEFPEVGTWTVEVLPAALATPPQKYSLVLGIPAPPAPNLNAGKVVFTSDRVNPPQLYLQNVGATTAPVKITNGAFAAKKPTWSPNGQYIAFLTQTVLVGSIFNILRVINTAGTIMQDYPAGIFGVDSVNYPVWSPDGKSIAVTANGLSVIKWDTAYDWPSYTTANVVANAGPIQPTEFTFSPDSSTIYFTSNGAIYRVPASGGTPYPIYGDAQPLRYAFSPSLAPDGRRLIYNSELWREDSVKYRDEELVQVDVLTGITSRLTWEYGHQYGWFATNAKDGEFVMQSTTSASGRYDIFIQQNGVRSQLYIADPTNAYNDAGPRWWKP